MADLTAQLRLEVTASDDARYATARAIANDLANVPHIATLLADREAAMRDMAAWMTATFVQGSDAARVAAAGTLLPALLRLTTDASTEVRGSAMRAIQFYATHAGYRDTVIPVMRDALRDSDTKVQMSAAFGLKRAKIALGDVALAFAHALGQPEPPGSNAHQEIAMMLEDMGPDAVPAVPALIGRLKHCTDPDLADSLAMALARSGSREASILLADLSDEASIPGQAAQRVMEQLQG